MFRLTEDAPTAFDVVARCKARGVLLGAFAERMFRGVTRLDVDRRMCETAAPVIYEAVEGR